MQLRIFAATSHFAAFHKISKVNVTKLLHWFWKLFLLPLIDHNESILTTHFGCGKLSLVEVKSLSGTSLFSEVFSVKFSQILLLKSKQVWIRNSKISQNKKKPYTSGSSKSTFISKGFWRYISRHQLQCALINGSAADDDFFRSWNAWCRYILIPLAYCGWWLLTLRKRYPYSEFFLPEFSRIRTKIFTFLLWLFRWT